MASSYRIVPTRKRHWLPLAVILAAGAAVVAFWPRTESPGFRPLCEAQGGIVVHLEDSGRLCLWAGAVIPVVP
jgi:hypothetical protein